MWVLILVVLQVYLYLVLTHLQNKHSGIVPVCISRISGPMPDMSIDVSGRKLSNRVFRLVSSARLVPKTRVVRRLIRFIMMPCVPVVLVNIRNLQVLPGINKLIFFKESPEEFNKMRSIVL